uniref:Uncharacterized protein n=1 Tax=Avena sativa TaxID=4498 RepID=A0ACD5V8U6_AVESA
MLRNKLCLKPALQFYRVLLLQMYCARRLYMLKEDITAQCRLEAFERQMRLSGQKSGNAIARYGWLGSGKQDIVSVITNGLLSTEKITHETEIGAGIYLSPENRAFTSVAFCDVDEKGVQYMLLCRAILGNTGVIKPGSQEEFRHMYDSGVDNCSNPNYYVMWPSHLCTHISLEYLISFRLAPKVQEYMLSLKGLWLRLPPKEVKVDLSILQPVLCQTDEGPTSPWISFRVLFETIQDSVSFLARELLYRHYEELKENKITRVEMVKRMMIIVGEELLLDTLTKLKYSPSLWYNSPAKIAYSPLSTTLEYVSTGTRNTDVEPATPSHDGPAPSVLPEQCEPVNSTCGASPATNAALRGLDSPTPSMCSESSSWYIQDPFAPIVAPLGHDTLVRSALLSVNVSDSAGPSMEYNGHDPLARSSYKCHDSDVSRPIFGNSPSPSLEGLHSVEPSMPPEAYDPLAPSRAHGNSSWTDSEGIGVATPGVAYQNYAPSVTPRFSAAKSMATPGLGAPRSTAPHLPAPRSMMPHLHGKVARDLSAPRSMAPHLSAPRSMAPHLRGKMPRVPEKITMPEANYSSAATTVPVIFEPQQSTMRNTPNPKNVAPKNPAAQCGANQKFPRIGVDDSSSVVYAAAGTHHTVS